MKKYLLASLLTLLTHNHVILAQALTEGRITIAKGEEKTGYTFQVNVPKKAVIRAVEKRLKAIKARYKEKKNIFRAERNILDSLSKKTIDLIVAVRVEKNDLVTINTIVDLGLKTFVNSQTHPTEDANIRRWLAKLDEEIKLQYLIYQLENEQDELKSLQRKLQKMHENQINWQKEIDNYIQKIENNKANMLKNEQEMEDQKIKIIEKQKIVDELKIKVGQSR